MPGALFYKNKEFKFIAIRSFVIQITAGTGAVIAALSGAGLYALLITPIVSSILIYIISFHRYPQHLRMTLGLSSIRKIFSYSVYQFLFNVICYFSRNLDKLLIGKHMGNVRPRILREVLPPHDASLAEYHTSGHSGDAPYLQ